MVLYKTCARKKKEEERERERQGGRGRKRERGRDREREREREREKATLCTEHNRTIPQRLSLSGKGVDRQTDRTVATFLSRSIYHVKATKRQSGC